jgi:AP-4 complex subunit epsilon-1
MTNAVNVEFIVEKLLSFLASATDDHFRTDLVGQITQCAERFAPSNGWYVQTIIQVFELAGKMMMMMIVMMMMMRRRRIVINIDEVDAHLFLQNY